jgi:hypothetical protein
MKQTFISVVVVLLLSCSNGDTTKISNDTAVKEKTDTTAATILRQKLIEELQRLRTIFSSNDRQKIADVFPFPLPDTTLRVYIDDSTYFEQLEKNGDKTTRAMFLHFFPQLYSSLQIDELNQLFKHISLTGLLQQNALEHEIRVTTEPCYKLYRVEVEQQSVILSIHSYSNENYISSSSPNDDMQENSSEYCESSFWWIFRFDGQKLHFVKIDAAG